MTDTPVSRLSVALFGSESPVSEQTLKEACELNEAQFRQALDALRQALSPLGLELAAVADGWRIQVRSDHMLWVQRLSQAPAPKLSRAQLETLAIIAHKQPVTRAEIEQIRGVSVSGNVLRALQQHGWIRPHGHKEVPGRPALWITTTQLLNDLGLQSRDALIQQLDTIIQQAELELHEQNPTH